MCLSRFPGICGSFSNPLFICVSPFPSLFFLRYFGLLPACPVCYPLLQAASSSLFVLSAFDKWSDSSPEKVLRHTKQGHASEPIPQGSTTQIKTHSRISLRTRFILPPLEQSKPGTWAIVPKAIDQLESGGGW